MILDGLKRWIVNTLRVGAIGLLAISIAGSAAANGLKSNSGSGGDLKGIKEEQAGNQVALQIGPEPLKTMKVLSFKVNLSGYDEPPKILIDLSMPGMFMGINRFYLKRKAPGLYQGQRIIPTCPTGKTQWLAKVIIDHSIAKEVLFHVQN